MKVRIPKDVMLELAVLIRMWEEAKVVAYSGCISRSYLYLSWSSDGDVIIEHDQLEEVKS